jgi:hypothetical protein
VIEATEATEVTGAAIGGAIETPNLPLLAMPIVKQQQKQQQKQMGSKR